MGCRKNKSDDSTSFVSDVRNHIDEFLHASMEEHKSCLKKTMQKMLGTLKAAVEHEKTEAKGIEISLPLHTTVHNER